VGENEVSKVLVMFVGCCHVRKIRKSKVLDEKNKGQKSRKWTLNPEQSQTKHISTWAKLA